MYEIMILGQNGSQASFLAYKFTDGIVKNIAGTMTEIQAPTKTVLYEDDAAGDATITINDTTDTVDIKVHDGALAGDTIWVVRMQIIEI